LKRTLRKNKRRLNTKATPRHKGKRYTRFVDGLNPHCRLTLAVRQQNRKNAILSKLNVSIPFLLPISEKRRILKSGFLVGC